MRLTLRKDFLTIAELMTRWSWTIHDMQYITECGDLKVYVRPLAIEAACAPLFTFDALERLKQSPLCPIDIHRLFGSRDGIIPIRQLQGAAPRKLTKHEIEIAFGDMIVRTRDIEEFEQKYAARDDFVLLSPDYRAFKINGEEIRFGDKQAAIAKHLHERLRADNPWVHGKRLMELAGSADWKIQNLFGKHKNWRIAICSDGRGYYKFNLPATHDRPPV